MQELRGACIGLDESHCGTIQMIGAMITHPQMAAIRVLELNLPEQKHGLGQSSASPGRSPHSASAIDRDR